jgi:hypothetical protein
MFTQVLLSAIAMLAGSFLVSAAAVAGSGSDASETAAASTPLPELRVAPPTDYPNVRLSSAYAFSGSAAFNPADPKRLAVGIVVVDTPSRCYVRMSADGGKTWGALVRLPQLPGATGTCYYQFVPAVTYGADGRLYAAYVYDKSSVHIGVAVSSSTDHGNTWSIPKSAFGDFSTGSDDSIDDLRLATAPDGSRVYAGAVLSRYVGGGFNESILFSRSDNHGLSWSPVDEIVTTYPDSGRYFSGFALAAGRSGNVLIAYGWEEYRSDYDSILKVARSTDYGASFIYGNADQYSSADGSPALRFPDIKIGASGTAHLVYGKGYGAEAAILYKFSLPPYRTWSAEPVRLDDDVPEASVTAPHLAVGTCASASILHATWLESLNGTKIRYARRIARPGYPWSEPLKVGQLNRVSEHGLAAAGARAFSVFSGLTATDPDKWGIVGSRVSSGITCP